MLEHPDVQRAFVTLAEEFKEARAGAPGSSKMKSKDTGNMEKDTKDFFASILTHFPTMIVDYSILEPGEEAFHIRRAVKTAFDPRLQSIHLNGKVSSKLAELLTEVLEQANHTPEGWLHGRRSE